MTCSMAYSMTLFMFKCNDHVQWLVQWSCSMTISITISMIMFNDHVQWSCSMIMFNDNVQWQFQWWCSMTCLMTCSMTCSMIMFNDHVQWHVQWSYSMTCLIMRMQFDCSICSFLRIFQVWSNPNHLLTYRTAFASSRSKIQSTIRIFSWKFF